jgi:hypothetical protein
VCTSAFSIDPNRIVHLYLVFLVEHSFLVYKSGFIFWVKVNSQTYFPLSLIKKNQTKNLKSLLYTKKPCSTRIKLDYTAWMNGKQDVTPIHVITKSILFSYIVLVLVPSCCQSFDMTVFMKPHITVMCYL